jgi:GAF domain-containing protein
MEPNNILTSIEAGTDTSKSMEDLLALTGQELKASRSYVFMVDPQHIGTNTHEWCLPGITPQKKSLSHFFVSEKWLERLQKNGLIMVSDITREDLKIRAELGRQNILSLVAVPLQKEDKLWGFMGVDECVVKDREWKPEEIDTLRRYSGLINDTYDQLPLAA